LIRNIIYTLLFFLTVSFTTSAQNIQAFADTDSIEYYVGDYINYTLELRYQKGITVTIPSIKDSISNLEFIKEETPIKEESGTEVLEIHKYIFSRYDSSDIWIPAYNIAYTTDGTNIQHVKVNPVNILVKTVDTDAQNDIRDVKDPIRIPQDWLVIIIIILVLVIAALASFFGYRYYKKKHPPQEQKEVKIRVLPYQKALTNLHELEDKKLWQQGMIKEYHTEVTGIIRDYFEERFHFQALEMTTPEIMDSIKSREVKIEVIAKTEQFLANADMVKFAKFQPMPTVNESMMKEAYFIVDNTKNKAAERELTNMKETDNAE